MNKLCENCSYRCRLLYYGSNKVAKEFVCYIQQDAGREYIPIQSKGEKEICDYYEKSLNNDK